MEQEIEPEEVPQIGDRVLWINGDTALDGILIREPMEGEDTGFVRVEGGTMGDGWIRRDALWREVWQKRLI